MEILLCEVLPITDFFRSRSERIRFVHSSLLLLQNRLRFCKSELKKKTTVPPFQRAGDNTMYNIDKYLIVKKKLLVVIC
jgi:hypothetical protein